LLGGELHPRVLSLEEAAGHTDVATLLEVGWVDAEAVGRIPSVSRAAAAVTYGPLADVTATPMSCSCGSTAAR